MRFRFAATMIAGAIAATASATPTGLTDDRNARDMTFAAEWFEGEFDNDLQVWFETDPRSATPLEGRHQRVHAVHERLPDTLLNAPAFRVREYRDDDRAKLVREHVVSFHSLKPADGIRMRYHRATPDAANAAAPEPIPGCDVILKRRGAQLEGRTEGSGCVSGTGKDRLKVEEEIWLGPDVYSRNRREISGHTGKLVSGRADNAPTAFYKARRFDCTADMFADNYLRPSPQDRKYAFDGRHDLGDLMTIHSPRDGKDYQLQLRRQRYPYYRSGGEFLLLRLREVGAQSSVAIVTADTGTDSISLNLGWAMVGCSARKP